MTDDPLERLRRLCMALPETTERLSHGAPTWFVRDKKTFVTFVGEHHGNRLAFWCAAPFGAQGGLVSSGPERFLCRRMWGIAAGSACGWMCRLIGSRSPNW